VTAYCTRSDLYRYGLSRGLLSASARLVDSMLASTDVVTLDGHGFETDDEIVFRAAEGGSLSAPLVAGTSYYAVRLNDSTFKVASAPSGAAINLSTDGVSVIVAIALPINDVIEFYSRFVDGFVPHAVPLSTPAPVIVRAIVAELSAKKLLQLAGHVSASVNEAELAAKAQLERWAKGIPLRDAAATVPSNKAATSSFVTTALDPRGWGTGTLP